MQRLAGLGDFAPVVPPLAERASWIQVGEDGAFLELPRGHKTDYLTHGLFRYAGKLPPPLVAYFLNKYCPEGGVVLDPMSGGGTTLVEAVTSGREAFGFDINPVSLLVSEAVSSPCDIAALDDFVERVVNEATPIVPTGELEGYFSDEAYGVLVAGLKFASTAAERLLMLSIARPASNANTKKINTVIDPSKTPKDPRALLVKSHQKFRQAFEEFDAAATAIAHVQRGKADDIRREDESVDLVLLHPPYLTNTAFSELTHLQLHLLGVQPKTIRSLELAYRGSYFSVPNGLRKYLIGWAKMIAEAARVVRSGGHVVVVNGDGRIDGVRIPVGRIGEEFAADAGLQIVERAEHVLNNQTGMTLSRRMTSQHVAVFEK